LARQEVVRDEDSETYGQRPTCHLYDGLGSTTDLTDGSGERMMRSPAAQATAIRLSEASGV
jgi:hypothetical protein